MGTPEFAVEPLRRLLDAGCEVAAVVTMPDKPAGRGMKLQQSAVKQFALSRGLRVLQPERLKDEGFLQELREINADLQIVVAFRMLPEAVWAMPRLGTFNLHASLLPRYRGAAPINHAIMNGDEKTGVTTFFLKHEIDTGDIILQREVKITRDDDAGSLHDKLMAVGAEAVIDTVRLIESGEARPMPQPADIEALPAPKIFKPGCRINFDAPCEQIRNFVRGLSPYPAAFTEISDAKGQPLSLKIFAAETEAAHPSEAPGTMLTDGKSSLKFAAADGYVRILRLQPAGKRPMNAAEFLRGFKAGN